MYRVSSPSHIHIHIIEIPILVRGHIHIETWVPISARDYWKSSLSWWRHQMETFSALLAICAGNSPVIDEFTAQRPVTRSFDVSFDLRLNKRLSKQWWGWGFETPSCPLWRHRNEKEHGLVGMYKSIFMYRVSWPSYICIIEISILVREYIHVETGVPFSVKD